MVAHLNYTDTPVRDMWGSDAGCRYRIHETGIWFRCSRWVSCGVS